MNTDKLTTILGLIAGISGLLASAGASFGWSQTAITILAAIASMSVGGIGVAANKK